MHILPNMTDNIYTHKTRKQKLAFFVILHIILRNFFRFDKKELQFASQKKAPVWLRFKTEKKPICQKNTGFRKVRVILPSISPKNS